MATWKTSTGLPDAIERREIIDGDRRDSVDLDALGDAYLNAGWLAYALDCFERTRTTDRLETIKRLAIEEEPFLLTRLEAVHTVTAADWRRAGEAALGSGKLMHAVKAFQRAGDEAKRAEAEAALAELAAEVQRPRAGRHAVRRASAPADAEGTSEGDGPDDEHGAPALA